MSRGTYQDGDRPRGIVVLIAVNAVVAIILLAMTPQYAGGRALLYLCVGLLHGVLALGLYLRYGWARIVMIIYAVFQSAGMALWSLIGLMTLIAEPLDRTKATFLMLSVVTVPFLIWAIIYLLRQIATETGEAEH